MNVTLIWLTLWGVFLTLSSSIAASLPEGYRYPTLADRTGAWKTAPENSVPFRAEGDFNGDGRVDRAWILLRESKEGWGVFVVLDPSDSEAGFIELAVITAETPPQSHGLRVVDPGQYDTACGKGYWECEPGEPEELNLLLPALDVYAFEGARSYFWWDPETATFVRTWMSD